MELSEVIMQRRSMRDYKDQPVPEDKLPPSSGEIRNCGVIALRFPNTTGSI